MKTSFAFHLLVLFLLAELSGHCNNYIKNPGFEGPDGIEVVPEHWTAGCGVMNTPDTQPGWWNIENEPHSGDSFLNLLYKEDGTTESVYQKLDNTLHIGSCFMIEIFLAQACQDSLSGLYHYGLNNPGDLTIRGSTDFGCDNGQILAVFEQVNNCEWKPFYAVFMAHEEINYIYLEFSKGISPSKDGSVLIDDFWLGLSKLLPQHELIVPFGEELTLTTTLEGSDCSWYANEEFLGLTTTTTTISADSTYIIEAYYYTDDGCLIIELWTIYLIPVIPNIVTSTSSDGINDAFYIKGLDEPCELSVLNRWGQTIYQNDDYKNDWSPYHLLQGYYYYVIYLSRSERYFTGGFYVQ